MNNRFYVLKVLAVLLICCVGIAQTQTTIDAGRGDVSMWIPTSYNKDNPLPLIVAIHGFTGSSNSLNNYWDISDFVDYQNFILCMPDATKDSRGRRFWNATAACCDMERSGIDDSGYLRRLIEQIQTEYSIDKDSIHITGYSNGGFMSYRMASDHADIVASIASLAGATYFDESLITPSESVHVLHVHGTDDTTVDYGGDCWGETCFPSAKKSVELWAQFNGCGVEPTLHTPLDLDRNIEGPETTILHYSTKESPIVEVELWSIHGAAHRPRFNVTFAPRVIKWLLEHRKPTRGDTVVPVEKKLQ
jgi:polyhydroxybutyrate depolymerase